MHLLIPSFCCIRSLTTDQPPRHATPRTPHHVPFLGIKTKDLPSTFTSSSSSSFELHSRRISFVLFLRRHTTLCHQHHCVLQVCSRCCLSPNEGHKTLLDPLNYFTGHRCSFVPIINPFVKGSKSILDSLPRDHDDDDATKAKHGC